MICDTSWTHLRWGVIHMISQHCQSKDQGSILIAWSKPRIHFNSLGCNCKNKNTILTCKTHINTCPILLHNKRYIYVTFVFPRCGFCHRTNFCCCHVFVCINYIRVAWTVNFCLDYPYCLLASNNPQLKQPNNYVHHLRTWFRHILANH